MRWAARLARRLGTHASDLRTHVSQTALNGWHAATTLLTEGMEIFRRRYQPMSEQGSILSRGCTAGYSKSWLRQFTRTLTFASVIVCTACGGGGGGSGSSTPPAAAAPPPTTSPGGSPVATTQIRLLAVASDSLAAVVGDVDLELNHLVNTSNDVLASNGVDVAFALDHIEVVSYADGPSTEQALEAITLGSDPALAHIAQLRDDLAADLVVFFRPYAGDGSCGYAWIGGYGTDGDFSNPAEADFGYSVVAADCSDYALLHELGHNLGLAHSRLEAPQGGSFEWGVGHGETNDFVTIMASPSAFNGVRLPQLSNPSSVCNGEPCGVPSTDATNGADAVRAIEAVADAVAAFR